MTKSPFGFEEQAQTALTGQPLAMPASSPAPSLMAMARAVRDAGVTQKDWVYFERSLDDIRMSRSDVVHRERLFGDWYDDFDDEAEPQGT